MLGTYRFVASLDSARQIDCELASDRRSEDRFDEESWEVLRCWKAQGSHRHGGGSPAPGIPFSQRQYDGDNWLDYCEPWVE